MSTPQERRALAFLNTATAASRKVRIYIPSPYGARIHLSAFYALRSLYLEGHRVKHAMVRAWQMAGGLE